MNKLINSCRHILESRWKLGEQITRMHSNFKYPQNFNTDIYGYTKNIESPLWLTNLPGKKKRVLSLENRKKAKMKKGPVASGPLMIKCQNSKLNHYVGMNYSKFDEMPLASRGWHKRKSKGDYFTILPTSEHPAFLAKSLDDLPTTFKETGLSTSVIEEINKMGFEQPTVIQMKSIPAILNGKSVMIAAETGCGKTLAYLAPIVNNVLKWKSLVESVTNSPFAVIVLPTRELAIQVGMVAHKFCSNLNIKCMILLGSKTKKMILEPVHEETDILICTLGVLSKLLTHRIYDLNHCKHFVLDEADTLLDDSFSEKLTYLIKRANLKLKGIDSLRYFSDTSQLCLVSATKPKGLGSILDEIISAEALVEISTRYLHRIQPHIRQEFLRMGPSQRPEALLKIMKKNNKENIPTMIFSNKTATCKWVNLFLKENGIECTSINADSKFSARITKYQSFREGEVNVISCTDLASRGLDCTRVKHVINFEFPRFIADYIHRCGRTGRINHWDNCLITNFISYAKEVPLLQEIEKAARKGYELQNVDNNIARIIKNRAMERQMAIDPESVEEEEQAPLEEEIVDETKQIQNDKIN